MVCVIAPLALPHPDRRFSPELTVPGLTSASDVVVADQRGCLLHTALRYQALTSKLELQSQAGEVESSPYRILRSAKPLDRLIAKPFEQQHVVDGCRHVSPGPRSFVLLFDLFSPL